MYHIIRFFFPFLGWLRRYRLSDLKYDATAGLSLALVLVPQSMANAQLAGLPAYHGIYAALVPAVVGGIWGSSRHMVTGMVAVISIMAATALGQIPISGPGGYIAYMAILTLLVGAIQLLFGVLRLGMVVNFLSLPVISGFTNAAAVIIAASQLNKLFGVTVESSGSQLRSFLDTLSSAWHYTHLPSLVIALLALGIILLVGRFFPRIPAVLAAVVVTTALSWGFGFEEKTTVGIDHIQSEQVTSLLLRLKDDGAALDTLTGALARLEQEKPSTQAGALQREYEIKQQQLQRDHLLRDMALVREHLRRTIFVSHKQEDGSRLFYVKRLPDADRFVPLSDAPAHPEHIGAAAADAGARQGQAEARAAAEKALPSIVHEFTDGKDWRLRVSSSPLDTSKLSFSCGGEVVGTIPAGLPHFTLPDFDPASLALLLPQALIIAFVGFAESISIAKAAANRKGYRIDANQELVGQGLANISGALVLTAPVAGSFSGSAVNLNAGARTGISCVFLALTALLVLFFFTGALYYLPQPVLAVIVMKSVGGLIKLDEFRRIWTARWDDGAIAIITFAATLFFAPRLDYGIAIGIILSLTGYFYRSMHPHIAELSCAWDNTLRDAKVFGLEKCRHIAIVHFQGSLFFANASVLEDYVIHRLETDKELQHLHLICTGITSIDASGEDALGMLVERAHTAGVETSFSGVVGSVAEILDRTGVLHMVGEENVFLTPREAICTVYSRVSHNVDCKSCPLSELFCREGEKAADYCSPDPAAYGSLVHRRKQQDRAGKKA